jgi:hypothetical protein
MNFMQQPRTFGKAVQRRQSDDFARMRSRYLDIFSQTELRLAQLYLRLGFNKPESSVGQKLGELNALKPSHALSRTVTKQIHMICRDLSRQVKIRNGMAHATMSVGTKSGEDVSFFQKASDAAADHPVYFVMTFDDFANAIDAINDVTSKLNSVLTPPSSPPQPKQAATTGP